MDHPWHLQVVNEPGLASDFAQDVHSLARLPQKVIGHRPLGLSHPRHWAAKALAALQIPVADRTPSGRIGNHPIAHGEALSRDAQILAGLRQQDIPRLGSGIADGVAGGLQRHAAAGVPFVGRPCRIGHHGAHALQGDIQLLGGDHSHRRAQVLAQLGLAAEHRHRAIGVEANPGIQGRGVL